MNRVPESSMLRTEGVRVLAGNLLRGAMQAFAAGYFFLGFSPDALAGSVGSQAPVATESAVAFPEYATVEELLRLDAQAALLAARRAVTNPLDDQQRPVRAAPQGNALLAIFGTGRALNAEVQIGQRIYTYRSAMRRAVAGGASPYLLEKIDPPCVHLAQGQQKEVLCLSQAQP